MAPSDLCALCGENKPNPKPSSHASATNPAGASTPENGTFFRIPFLFIYSIPISIAILICRVPRIGIGNATAIDFLFLNTDRIAPVEAANLL
jgi:hypothetical protein